MDAFTVSDRWRAGRVLPLLATLLWVAAFAAFAALVVEAPRWFLALVLLSGAYNLYQRLRPRTLLQVDAEGIRMAGQGGRLAAAPRRVPWSSVREVVVMSPPATVAAVGGLVGVEVGVRLRQGAPLPDNVRGIVHDPTRPDAVPPGLRVALGSSPLDRDRLAVAVAAFGPPDVRVVDEPLAAGTLGGG
jgi:hypothetical protein